MTDAEEFATIRIAQSFKTRGVTDLAAQAILLRAAKERSKFDYDFTRQIILQAREDWLTWLTLTQRKWQTTNTRRPKKARHHDSIQIRERYVRCHA